MLYDSERYCVVYHEGEAGRGKGVEVVDKVYEASVYLHGGMYAGFAAHMDRWKQDTPSKDEVEACLESYTRLAMTPLVQH